MKRILVKRVRTARPKVRTAIRSQSVTRVIDNQIIRKFNPTMLDLGDISTPCQEREAIAAVFDLTGFTAFCNQVDSYLAIPRFLNDFLEWFFKKVREGLTEVNYGNRSMLMAELPFMVKFLGDGLLLLWNARRMTEGQICRVAATLYQICHSYRQEFYPQMSMTVNKPPKVLRCGVARGKIFSVGNGNDYVGHCINNASRLSKVHTLSFCFPHRGFQVREHMPVEYLRLFTPKYVSIRGVGENELVWVVKEEFEGLPEKSKVMFRNLEPVAASA
jgi:class 3 adenylate cyclase